MVGNICVINGQRGGPPGGPCGLPGRKPSAVTDAHHLHRGILSLHRGHHRLEQGLDRSLAGPWIASRWLTRTRPGKCFGHVGCWAERCSSRLHSSTGLETRGRASLIVHLQQATSRTVAKVSKSIHCLLSDR